jgi:hypothetical protein
MFVSFIMKTFTFFLCKINFNSVNFYGDKSPAFHCKILQFVIPLRTVLVFGIVLVQSILCCSFGVIQGTRVVQNSTS